MSGFKSAVAKELIEYLSIREMTLEPDSFRIDLHTLGDFDGYYAACGDMDKVVTEELINGWIQHLKNKNHTRTVSNKVSCLRCFLRYLRYCGVSVFMPQCPKWHEDYIPYIFSDTEMGEIFRRTDKTAADIADTEDFQAAMLIRLLYGCGLRHGEALTLIRSDVDFNHATLLMRQPKNKKQRIVPMHQSLSNMLMQYCAAMKIFDKPDALLFPGRYPDRPMQTNDMRKKFRAVLKAAEIYVQTEKPYQRGQCLHCLRHVFAVKSFAQAEKNGYSSAESIPYLSVYLGHFDMDGTEKYLKFSSDIFPEHTDMFEAYSVDVFTVLGGAK
jgi:site-specific recombinase XerD